MDCKGKMSILDLLCAQDSTGSNILIKKILRLLKISKLLNSANYKYNEYCMKPMYEAFLEVLSEGLIKVSGDNMEVLITFFSPAKNNN